MRPMGKARLLSAILVCSLFLITVPATSASAMDVTLAWDANSETDLAGYKIYYGTTAGGLYNGTGSSDGASAIIIPLSRLIDPASPEFTVHGLPDGTYYLAATAYNTDGIESGYSNEVSVGGNAAPVLSSLEVNGQTGNTFVVDSSRPSLVGSPVINYTDSTVTVTYSESNMRNATIASNYSFNNGLLLNGNGTDTSGTNKVFKFPLNPGTLQRYVIYAMQISSAVTDELGNTVLTNTARVNDDDNDGMADDWEKQWFGSIAAKNGSTDSDTDGLTDGSEYNYARSNSGWGSNRWSLSPVNQDSDGDGIPDRYELLSGLNPVSSSDRDLDSDNDGWSNYEEYLYGTSANDPNSCPQPLAAVEVVEAIPLNNSGVPPSNEQIPNNTAFGVRMESVNGIDMTDPDAVTFSVNDGSNTYTRRLNDFNGSGTRILKALPLDADGNSVYSLWVVYYRSNETSIANSYPYDSVVEVSVTARDADGQEMEPISFRFKIEGKDQDSARKGNIPETVTSIDASSSKKTVSVVSGPLEGASVTYESNLMQEIGLEPYIGPAEDIPPLSVGKAVGVAVTLLPPAVFPNGVTVTIPCPGYKDVSTLSLYYYDGEKWILACDSAGNVTPEGEGWMVPGSRVNHNGNPSYVEIGVYHFSAVIAATTSGTTVNAETGGGGGGCFIDSLMK